MLHACMAMNLEIPPFLSLLPATVVLNGQTWRVLIFYLLIIICQNQFVIASIFSVTELQTKSMAEDCDQRKVVTEYYRMNINRLQSSNVRIHWQVGSMVISGC